MPARKTIMELLHDYRRTRPGDEPSAGAEGGASGFPPYEVVEYRPVRRRRHVSPARLWASAAVAYGIAAFLVFGWSINHKPCKDYGGGVTSCVERDMDAVFSGGGWPIYFAGAAAIAVTRWP